MSIREVHLFLSFSWERAIRIPGEGYPLFMERDEEMASGAYSMGISLAINENMYR